MRTQAGGLARRVGLHHLLAAAGADRPRLWLDAGNAAAPGKTPIDQEKTRAIMQVMGELGVRAAHVAETELAAGLEFVTELAATHEVPLVSASLTFADEEGGHPFPLHLTVEVGERRLFGLRRGDRLAVIGVMRDLPDLAGELNGRPVKSRSAEDALRAGLASARADEPDLIVLLAALPENELTRLLEDAPDVDVALGSIGDTVAHGRAGNAEMAFSGARGQWVVEMQVGGTREEPRLARRQHRLEKGCPIDREAWRLQRATSRRINELNREQARLAATTRPTEARATHAGAVGCRSCHVAEYLAWEGSSHAHALETLEGAEADFNPDCLRCHVTSLGQPGGFVSAIETPDLGGVQCESCHGAALAHAASAGRERTVRKATEAACRSCHDQANSPTFSFAEYWPKIRHGSP